MNQDLQDIVDFYARVRPDCEKFYADKAPLNEFWGGINLRQMRDIIHRSDDLHALVHGAQRTFMFSVNKNDESEQLACEWLLKERENRRKREGHIALADIQESEHSVGDNTVTVDGKSYTPDLLRCVTITERIRTLFQISQGTVVELGGGLGHLARVMRLGGAAKRHIIVDLPETLCFSMAFLRLNFPDATFQMVGADDKVGTADFTFIPVAYAEAKLKDEAVGLFLNTASMGEMRNETVRYWWRVINDVIQPARIYTLNRYLNTITPQLMWRTDENECQQHYGPHWDTVAWDLEPTWTRCPFVDTLVSRYLEYAAIPRTGMTPEAGQHLARALKRMVAAEDWWRLREQGHVMGVRDNPLVIDTGRGGALCKLWESIRFEQSADTVTMMLTYLNRLCRRQGEHFEEAYYYEQLLNRLNIQDGL